jgi:hypothetical protein
MCSGLFVFIHLKSRIGPRQSGIPMAMLISLGTQVMR